jgi:hypothetical protein
MSTDISSQATSTSTAKSLKLREASFEDYPHVVALESKFHLDTKNYEAWTHLWTNNPAYRKVKDKFPIGWVLENREGTISGYLGNIPLDYEFDGKRLLAATTRAWVVDTAFRAYSPLLLDRYFSQSDVELFMNTTVNSHAAQAYSVFQGVRVPVGAWDRSLFWITSYQGFTESVLRKKRSVTTKALSYPLSPFVFLRDRLMRRRFQGKDSGMSVIPCAGFDDRFDAFWAALRKKKSNLLLAVRTQEVLEWHFKSALAQDAAWIYAVEGSSGLAAYAVFLRQDQPELGLTRVRLADFKYLEEETGPAQLTAMLQTAIDRCRRDCIHMLEIIGLAPSLERETERLSPYRRDLPSWLYFYKANDSDLAEKLKNAAVWEPSLFDGDSSL